MPVYPVASKDVYLCEEKGDAKQKPFKCFKTHSSGYIILSPLLTEGGTFKFLF